MIETMPCPENPFACYKTHQIVKIDESTYLYLLMQSSGYVVFNYGRANALYCRFSWLQSGFEYGNLATREWLFSDYHCLVGGWLNQNGIEFMDAEINYYLKKQQPCSFSFFHPQRQIGENESEKISPLRQNSCLIL